MRLAHLQRCSLADFPGHVCATVFTQGCHWRCPYCHNASLLPAEGDAELSREELYRFLDQRAKHVSAVCVTGGEPTEHPDLPWFLATLKHCGLQVKLDTNGGNPEMLDAVLHEGLVDYVAMDVKGPLSDYGRFAGVKAFDSRPLCESISRLRAGGVDYEFRTTVIPGWHDAEVVRDIAAELSGSRVLYLQAFRPDNAHAPALRQAAATPPELLHSCAEAAKPFLPTRLRGA
ncbi:MAG: anaerobic ribonucleoside-triphosphate reductase activating protein [Opitutales bacterium]